MRSEKGGFQLIQILGLLGKYFDAVVVEVKTFFTFIQIGSGHTVEYLEALHLSTWTQIRNQSPPTDQAGTDQRLTRVNGRRI